MKKNSTSIRSLNRPNEHAARRHRVSILLNDSEMRAIERYCERYGIRNRSRFIRESLIRNVLKQFEKDSPTLFD